MEATLIVPLASELWTFLVLLQFVSRLNDSRQVLERKQAAQLLRDYTVCREWLELSCLDSLFPGATYARRVTALHLLSAVGVTPTPAAATTLLSCLSDSYEDVKTMAMKLLTSSPRLLDQVMVSGTDILLLLIILLLLPLRIWLHILDCVYGIVHTLF